MNRTPNSAKHLILYDGVCGLCNRFNTFVLSHDKQHQFDFASLQSGIAGALLTRHGRNPAVLETLFVVVDYQGNAPQLLSRAEGALFVIREMGFPWRAFRVLGILPEGVLNFGYDLIARNRYRIFGRYDSCPLPTPEDKSRFIDL